jgi:hypothetical protein
MQQSLNIFQLYCDLWKLDVNINKTKVMVFIAKRRILIIHLYYKIKS